MQPPHGSKRLSNRFSEKTFTNKLLEHDSGSIRTDMALGEEKQWLRSVMQ
jgi:hypothetical protein